jgi:hypothetical protein
MPDQHGFGDNRTQSARLCQPRQGNDQMDEQDEQVAHPGNSINTSEAAAVRLIWQFAMDRILYVPGFGLFTDFIVVGQSLFPD